MAQMAEEQNRIECYKIFHKTLHDYVVFIKPSNTIDLGAFGKLVLRSVVTPNASNLAIKIDLTNSGIDMKDIWTAIMACHKCVQVWHKLKDMLFSLLAQLHCPRYTMLRTRCRLFVSRIYSNSWRRQDMLLVYSPPNAIDCHDQELRSYGNLVQNFENSGDNQSKKSSKYNLRISTENNMYVMSDARNSVCSPNNNKVRSSLKRKRGKAEKIINREDLEPFFSGSMMVAAKSLGVSRSTIKRKCRLLGILEWPSSKGNKRSCPLSGNQKVPMFANDYEPKAYLSCSKNNTVRRVQDKEITKHSRFYGSIPAQIKVIGGQKEISSTVKATYREDMIRFHFPLKSGIMELKKEVKMRLNLELGTFKLKYWDDDDELTLLACDSDWQDCIWISRSFQRNVIRLLVQDA